MNMIARVFFTVLSVVLAIFMMRLVLGETRRARVPVRNHAPKGAGHVAHLKQDPATGVYYPVD